VAEVILAAGSVNSPQLLELSGIGRPEVLGPLGIPVRHPLEGVGEGLRDPIAPRIKWRITQRGITFNDRARGVGLAWQVAPYLATRRGFLGLPSAPLLAFFRSREGLESPDGQLHLVPYTYAYGGGRRELTAEPGMTVAIYQLRPESLGSIHVASSDPRDPPAIRLNFLSDEIDRRTLIDAVRFTRRLVGARAMAGFRGEELRPGPAVESEDAILAWIRETAETAYHPVGTAGWGPTPARWSTPSFAFTGWPASGSRTDRSCRPSSRATPMPPAS